jgi:hypothetical protein
MTKDYMKLTRDIATKVGSAVTNKGDTFEGVGLLCFDEHGAAHFKCVITGFFGPGDPTQREAHASEHDGSNPDWPGETPADKIAFILLERIY